MSEAKVLVVYDSRTGATRLLALAIAKNQAMRAMRERVGRPAVAECKVIAAEARKDTNGALAVFAHVLEGHIARFKALAWMC